MRVDEEGSKKSIGKHYKAFSTRGTGGPRGRGSLKSWNIFKHLDQQDHLWDKAFVGVCGLMKEDFFCPW